MSTLTATPMTRDHALDIAAGMSPTFFKIRPSILESTPLQGEDHSSFPWLQVLIDVVIKSSETEKNLVEERRKLLGKYRAYDEQIGTLKGQAEGLQSQQSILLSQVAQLEAQTKVMEEELETYKGNEEEHKKLLAQHEQLKESSEQLTSRLTQIETEKAAIDKKLTACNQQVEELMVRVETLAGTIEESNKKLVELEQTLEAEKKRHDASRLKLSRSKSNVSALRTDLGVTQKELLATRRSLEDSQTSLDSQTRAAHFYQFIPSLDRKVWTDLFTRKCEKMRSPVLLACYLVSALFRYTVYKLYSQWLVQNQLKLAYEAHSTSGSFKQAISSIETNVLEKFTGQSVRAQQIFLKAHE